MSEINDFKDLKIWQKGMEITEKCYFLTKDFPKDELYGMVQQIRRAAVSIPANIAEGYGRRTKPEYVRFLNIAQGSIIKEGIGNGEQGTESFRWGFIPHLKQATYRSGSLLLPDREQEIGKTVPCSLFPVPFFDELETHIILSKRVGLSQQEDIEMIISALREESRMIISLIKKLES